MDTTWIVAYNKLFQIINTGGDTYYSGPAFIQIAQQVDERIPNYNQYIEMRNQKGLSTSRKDFYWDIIKLFDEKQKYQFFRIFIDTLESHAKEEVDSLRAVIFKGSSGVPKTTVPPNLWNSEKLNILLKEIDEAIDLQQYNRAVTLSYTCLEGLYKAYIQKNIPNKTDVENIGALAKLVKNDISKKLEDKGAFPKEIVNSMSTITNAVANSRNEFSESHFDKNANKWLAIFARDLTNSIGRLLLHFI